MIHLLAKPTSHTWCGKNTKEIVADGGVVQSIKFTKSGKDVDGNFIPARKVVGVTDTPNDEFESFCVTCLHEGKWNLQER